MTGRLASWVMNDLRVTIFRHLQRLSLDFFTEEKAGVVMSRMTSDIENLQQLLQDGLAQFAMQGLTMVVIAVFLFTTNVRLAIITIVVVHARRWSSCRSGSSGPPSAATTRSATASPWCWPTSPRACRACASSPPTTASATTSCTTATWSVATATPTYYTGRINGIYGPGSQLLGVIGQVVILAVGGDMVLHHQLQIGALVDLLPLRQPVLPADPAPGAAVQLLPAGPGVGTQAARPCWRASRRCSESADAIELPPIRGEIRFDHVSFGYDPAVPVLRRHRPAPSSPARPWPSSGATGAGKSTMAKLVTRFYDPTAGPGADRRPRPAHRDLDLAAQPARRGAPGAVPLRRHHPGQHLLRPTRRAR